MGGSGRGIANLSICFVAMVILTREKHEGMIHPLHLQEALRHLLRETSLETVLKGWCPHDIQIGTGSHYVFSKGTQVGCFPGAFLQDIRKSAAEWTIRRYSSNWISYKTDSDFYMRWATFGVSEVSASAASVGPWPCWLALIGLPSCDSWSHISWVTAVLIIAPLHRKVLDSC